jgi:heat shock protein HslJ
MSKIQIISYAGAVLLITVMVYLYTSEANAPQNAVNADDDYIHSDLDSNTESNINAPTEVPPIDTVEPKPTKTEPGEVMANNSLINTSWRWLRTENATGTITIEPKNSKPFVLRFTASSTITSQTDCNSIGGEFTQNNFTLSFGPLMSTLMYCEGSKEAEYSQNLSAVQSYEIVDNTLRLFLKDNSGTMFFVRIKN